jgi:ribosome-associated toxin RatA of RatAB toxin-antitoxin module
MYKISRHVVSQHPAKMLYDVVNDTVSYQTFVPFCSLSEVLEEKGDEKTCHLVFSQGGLSRSLTTRNRMSPHHNIEVHLIDGDFSHLFGRWQFTPVEQGTLVDLYFEYQFSHQIIQHTFGQMFKPITIELINTFCQRADEISLR